MLITNIKERIHSFLWQQDLSALHGWQSSIIFFLRILSAVIRDIAGGLPTLRAMSLVYTTLLSLVPLLAVSFSVLKGFGVHNQIEPMLLQLFAPLGDKGTQITTQIIDFVDNIKVGVLGSLGLGLLIYTVISLIKKIESAFNFTWRITRYRSIAQRFTDYLSVVMVGPVLVFTAMGITASVSNSDVLSSISTIEPFGTVFAILSKLVPYILIICAFTFIYKLVPNTQVRLKSAFIGALFAGLLWETTGWLFATFVANSANYTAVYSGFAVLMVFMIWLYLSWMILLIGSSISFYHQHPERISNRQQILRLSCRLREKLALLVMHHVAHSFHYREPYWTTTTLAKRLDVAAEALGLVLNALEDAGIVIRSGNKEVEYVPAQSLEKISLIEVLNAVRAAEETPYLDPDKLHSNNAIDTITHSLYYGLENSLSGKTLRDIID